MELELNKFHKLELWNNVFKSTRKPELGLATH